MMALSPKTSDLNFELLKACETGNNKRLEKLLLNKSIDVNHGCGSLLLWTVRNNNIIGTKMLLSHPNIDPSCWDNRALDSALVLKRKEIVKLLLNHPKINPRLCEAKLTSSIGEGNIFAVKLLLRYDSFLDFVEDSGKFVFDAVMGHNSHVLELVLDNQKIKISGHYSQCIMGAIYNKLDKIFYLLLFNKRVRNVFLLDQELLEAIWRDYNMLVDVNFGIIMAIISIMSKLWSSTFLEKIITTNGYLHISKYLIFSNQIDIPKDQYKLIRDVGMNGYKEIEQSLISFCSRKRWLIRNIPDLLPEIKCLFLEH